MAQWIEHQPANWKVTSLIPSQGTCLGCGPGPRLGACWETADRYFYPCFSPSLLLSLKINKIYFFLRVERYRNFNFHFVASGTVLSFLAIYNILVFSKKINRYYRNQLPRWLQGSLPPGIHSPLWSPPQHCTTVGPCDHKNTAYVMLCHLQC